MKIPILLTVLFLISGNSKSQSYLEFPDDGWSQTQLFTIHNGLGWNQSVEEFRYTKDTVINGMTYRVITANDVEFFARNDEGKIYWLHYSGEALLYDFSLNLGDTLNGFYFLSHDVYTVTVKEKVPGPSGDSLWYMEVKTEGNWPDPERWMEGVGNLSSGLFPFTFPDAGYSHICTRNKNNQTYYASTELPPDCNCDYIHGEDMDGDGFRNSQTIWKYISLGPLDFPPSFVKNGKHRRCDTLVILNDTGYSIEVLNDENKESIYPDSITDAWKELFFYNLDSVSQILITHQFSDVYYKVQILECEMQDCNDEDSTVNAGHVEIPYNSIDNDCNPATPDDDIDMDGFTLDSDCDDGNALINPYQAETIYNGHDDDCDPLTLDDDIDQDGFNLAGDCDDNNAGIFPGAQEILNNGIDEDCDGQDLISSTHDFEGHSISIYPNPVCETLYIQSDFQCDLTFRLYDATGIVKVVQSGIEKIDVSGLSPGVYFLELLSCSYRQMAVEKIVILQAGCSH